MAIGFKDIQKEGTPLSQFVVKKFRGVRVCGDNVKIHMGELLGEDIILALVMGAQELVGRFRSSKDMTASYAFPRGSRPRTIISIPVGLRAEYAARDLRSAVYRMQRLGGQSTVAQALDSYQPRPN